MRSVAITPDHIQGAVSLEAKPGGLKPWRIAYTQARLFPPDGAVPFSAGLPAGVRLRFRTDSPVVELTCTLEPHDSFEGRYDFRVNGDLADTQVPVEAGPTTFRFEREGDGEALCEIWLAIFMPIQLESLRVAEGCSLEPVPDTRLKWLTYGSSITKCRTADGASLTWPAVAARQCDLNLTCLGFGGQCHLEAMVGRMLRDLPADIITLKLGINVYGASSLTPRTYPGAVIGLIQLIREKHTRTPIGLITPILSPEREAAPNNAGMTLEDYRVVNRDAFERLRALGDERLFLFEGPEVLLGLDDAHLLPDDLHPNGEGYQLMGRRAAERILPKLLDAREIGG
ncbi:MAG: SGNH/GDSL hydrolase family protein [Opitutales bacterium]